MNTFNAQTIWIIGASSGIGRAVAAQLAEQGATLILSARREDKLHTLSTQLPGTHHIAPIDAAQNDLFSARILRLFKEHGTIHRILFFPAIYKPGNIIDIDPDFAQEAMQVNVVSAYCLAHVATPLLQQQSFGQLAFCASVAGFIGLPGGQPYSATKAALINLVESLRAETAPHVDIKLINPGFVKTDLTDKNDFKMPMIISGEKAARYITDGLRTKSFEIHFPKRFTLLVKLARLLPYWLALKITKRLN